MLYRVYVDEAGDRGISAKSDQHFVVSAVIVVDHAETQLRTELAGLRTTLGRHPGHVLHFKNFSHSHRLKAAQDVSGFSLAAITSVIVHKDLIGQPMPAGNMALISRPDPMYLWALRLLLERVSWFVDEHQGTKAIVTFSHVKGFKAHKLHSYRQALENTPPPDMQVRWHVFNGYPFRIRDQKQVELLQLADTAASALFKAIEPDAFGNREDRYLQALRPKLYRRGNANVVSYGLKVFPTHEGDPGGSLDWLRTY